MNRQKMEAKERSRSVGIGGQRTEGRERPDGRTATRRAAVRQAPAERTNAVLFRPSHEPRVTSHLFRATRDERRTTRALPAPPAAPTACSR